MVTVLSVPLGWVGWELDQRRKEKEVVRWIEEIGGVAVSKSSPFRFLYNAEIFPDDERNWWEKTKDKWFGEREQFVFIDRTQVSDLSPLTKLDKLEWLVLFNTPASDLPQLEELKNLRWLYLESTQVSHAQVQELRLALPDCKIDF